MVVLFPPTIAVRVGVVDVREVVVEVLSAPELVMMAEPLPVLIELGWISSSDTVGVNEAVLSDPDMVVTETEREDWATAKLANHINRSSITEYDG